MDGSAGYSSRKRVCNPTIDTKVPISIKKDIDRYMSG
jgi:hypothetical protein